MPNMASSSSPAQFVFNFEDYCKKDYDSCFPGLIFSSSQNLMEEFGLQKHLSKTLDDLKSRGFGETSLNNTDNMSGRVSTDQETTPKAQKQKPSDVKRWASVVKAQKKIQHTTELDFNDNHHSESAEVNSEIFDCIFKTFPRSFESHKSFFVINDKMFYCNICLVNLDSVLSLSNHLKTRKHEDNAIEYFKAKMPAHLHHIMEFVSFFGSNLCCNLCHCKISMSSHNPHETIVNIMAHNSDDSHVSKVNRETSNSTETILQTLSASSNVIMENMHFIESRMVPEFRCQLCKVKFTYENDHEVLSKNLVMHMKSVGHNKNQKAVEVLKLFGEASIAGKDNFSVVNGNIMCTYCNCEFETNLQQLISHVNEVEHATKVLFKLNIPSNFNEVSEKDTVQENMLNEAKSVVLNKPKKGEGDKEQSFESSSALESKPGCRLKELLGTMPPTLRDVDYVIENENGSITCLVCNRVVPPSTYNLRTHLLGNKHKANMELKNIFSKEIKDSNKALPGTSRQNLNSEYTMKDDHFSKLTKNTPTFKGVSQPKIFGVPNIFKQFGYILKIDNDSLTCMLCQCTVPTHSFVQEHLTSSEHVKKENEWLKNCPGCLSRNPFTFRVLKALPTSIRIYKCRQVETIPASVLNHLYSLLMDENQLIKNNEKVLVKNVDGKHSYCTLCKALVPLSLDLDILENNVVIHLKEKRHEALSKKKTANTHDASTSPNVARSLFDLADQFEKLGKDSKVFNFEEFTRLVCKSSSSKALEAEKKSSVLNVSSSSTVPEVKNEVFVFGDSNSSFEDPKCDSREMKRLGSKEALPVGSVSHLVKFEEETSDDVLSRRQKQIDYGKNTEGYTRYSNLVPRRKRNIHHPVTPPKHLRCSRRTWDGMIRAWRRQLHVWDPPSSVDSDIQPLA